ncbi:hypothetical protein [Trichocoleus sp. FACHB-262]|uniref:hypothetical protein n=1 Tax=Trichocoleus sp. FACHB-262 TaxID=2692869 RepID=UPI00168513CA|nr:hypothetical protein [Trichocoleus sp. FACHB-262]MBD2122715.1 hypothetical protein [Trichocoleus sp. FACHB-262]
MTEKNVEQQAAEINQEVQALVEKTDECAAQINMEEMLKVGKKQLKSCNSLLRAS